ncbi:cell wall-associated NlpC family hydrolase [Allocatelliglobosispora scoriae]|uniref:Cell wall-associated NlpC family hydrolase n=1 Tax=Allocatelliglobosispora scoriae TaxID=643052 RepID=A0A841BTM6_9ACTN|nr:C40 family peptidase [Allocatelliglobosispora scoriae]MBB5870776.1 cell wall-associated NlpC family hydrolase [Allocatelliglobosispora scoriae]
MTRRGAGAARLSALLTATIITTTATSAHAAPTPSPSAMTSVPDSGVRPVPNGTLSLPFGNIPVQSTATTAIMALANQLSAAQLEVGVLAEKLRVLDEARITAKTDLLFAEYAKKQADERLEAAKAAYDEAMSRVYQEQGGVPGLGLDGLAPRVDDPMITGASAARDLSFATESAAAAKKTYDKAVITDRDATAAFGALEVTYRQREAALLELRKRHADQLAVIEREQERQEQQAGGGFPGDDVVGNYQANPRAVAAVRFALSQRGKPYEWGSEGPNRYDCSGLMWRAYKTVGESLPRVSRDQYQGTKSHSVGRYDLLPGDLLFFATDSYNSDTIHHVGMYIGDGKMVHAPTTGDVVKISTVWWSRFYGATRVLPAVPKASTSPSATSSPSRTTSPSPSPSRTTSPSTSPSPSSSPSKSPSSSPSPVPPVEETTEPEPQPEPISPQPISAAPSPTPDPAP